MTKITKAEFETLPESLKGKFKAEGDEFVMDEPDVSGLKKNKDDLLKELKELKDKYGDLDPLKAKEALDAAKAAEDEKLKAAGDFEKLKEQLLERHKTELAKITGEKDSLFADVHKERLTNELIKRGVMADRAAYLVSDLVSGTELVKDDSGKYALRKKGGIGDATEFDLMIQEAKTAKPFFFESKAASGSGASGSQNSGNANTITRAQFDANPGQYAAKLGSGELQVTD